MNVYFDDFKVEVSKIYKKYFPNGYIGITTGCLGSESISIETLLVDEINVTKHNDPMLINLWLHNAMYETGVLKETVVLEKSKGFLSINPPKDSFYAMENVKIPFRKTTGDIDKVYKAIDRFYKRAKDIVNENESNIYNRDKYNNKYFK